MTLLKWHATFLGAVLVFVLGAVLLTEFLSAQRAAVVYSWQSTAHIAIAGACQWVGDNSLVFLSLTFLVGLAATMSASDPETGLASVLLVLIVGTGCALANVVAWDSWLHIGHADTESAEVMLRSIALPLLLSIGCAGVLGGIDWLGRRAKRG